MSKKLSIVKELAKAVESLEDAQEYISDLIDDNSLSDILGEKVNSGNNANTPIYKLLTSEMLKAEMICSRLEDLATIILKLNPSGIDELNDFDELEDS